VKKYILLRLLFIIINLIIIFVFFYFVLEYATNEKYYGLAFSEYYKVTLSNFKVYIFKIIRLGDWGTNNEGIPVWEVLVERIGISLKINLLALALYVPAGILLGFISAQLKNTFVDRFISTTTLTLGSIPTYILMYLLVMFVGYYSGLVHYQYVEGAGINNYYLPVFALSIPPIATFTRVIRGELIESLNSDHLLLARAKGLNKRQLMWKHLLKGSSLALLPEIPSAFLFALTGSFFVELVYHIPGVAELFYDSLLNIGPFGVHYVNVDLNIMMIIMLFYMAITLIVILIVDILHRVLDPRIFIGSKSSII